MMTFGRSGEGLFVKPVTFDLSNHEVAGMRHSKLLWVFALLLGCAEATMSGPVLIIDGTESESGGTNIETTGTDPSTGSETDPGTGSTATTTGTENPRNRADVTAGWSG